MTRLSRGPFILAGGGPFLLSRNEMTQVKQKTPKFPSKVKGVSEIAESAVLKRVLQKKAQMEKLLLEIEKDLDSNIKLLEKLKAQPKIKI